MFFVLITVGKTFQTAQNQLSFSQNPRKALGDVNTQDVIQAVIRKGLGKLDANVTHKLPQPTTFQKQNFKFLKPPAPASKPPREKSNKPVSVQLYRI